MDDYDVPDWYYSLDREWEYPTIIECDYFPKFTGHWERLDNGYFRFIIDHTWLEYDCFNIPN